MIRPTPYPCDTADGIIRNGAALDPRGVEGQMETSRRPPVAHGRVALMTGRSAVAAVVLLLLARGAPASAGGASFTYPADCPTKVQDCIDLAGSGDSVVLAADGLIDELLLISNKGITLQGQAGFHPNVRTIHIRADAGSVDVTVEGLQVDRFVDVSLSGGSDHRVVLRKLDLDQQTDRGDTGLSMSTSVPATLVLERSRVHTESTGRDSVSIAADDPDGLVTIEVRSNRIDQVGGAGNAGLRVGASGDGTLRVAIRSTTIRDVAEDSSGGGAGVTLHEVVGSNGINLRNDAVGAGHLDLAVFDTIFSSIARNPMVFDPAGPITFRAGHNDRWRTGGPFEVGGRSMGPVNLAVDPRFVDPDGGNLRLRADSPLIDRGLVCSPAGVSERDAAGRARLAGAGVDIGGHEHAAGPDANRVRLGTSSGERLTGSAGADILCGFGGPDELSGRGGADWLDGGAGPDRLVGGAGPDRMLAGVGDDALCGRDGAPGDRLVGGPGSDRATRDRGDTLASIESTAGCSR